MLHPLGIEIVFTAEECVRVIQQSQERLSSPAGMVGGVKSDNLRRSRITWLDEDGDAAWIFRRLLDTFAEANRRHFQFDLEEVAEGMQVAWYGEDNGGFFDWHVDFGDGATASRRKLTMVVQLSEHHAYDGGGLQTNADGVVRSAERAIGSALLLPSFVLHRVSPVTRGERYSLTLWSHGLAFR